MTTHTEEHLETGVSSHAHNHQSTPLLLNNPGPIHYGSNDSAETLGKCRTNTKSSMETDSEEEHEEGSLLAGSTENQRQPTTRSKSMLDAVLFSPLHRFCYTLTGGRCDEVSLRLQNSGSVARDHLALERTFLAYMRTSLAIASAGVALVQLFNTSNKADTERIEKFARPLGASLIAMGLVVLGVGLVRYFVVQASLVKGMFPVTRLTPIFIAVSLSSLVTIVFWLLLTGRLEFN
ncbi:hypothetical protein D9756_004834 [Leucocoprinus leucothites]|uniref:DUF202 domain-containing protein n=1 Tax=Leucocoprinus leucothites TaxID=201217 RepID=A0A8H5GA28_9AGAR|nr:hypothetical protein D9756_004834 [Leucoagaricus leucothites]